MQSSQPSSTARLPPGEPTALLLLDAVAGIAGLVAAGGLLGAGAADLLDASTYVTQPLRATRG